MPMQFDALTPITEPELQSYLRAILNASIYDLVIETKLELGKKISTRLGQQIWLKREDTQAVFSFKLRGAYNKLLKLSPELREKGVIAVSAGNHAQGVAMAAQHLNMRAVIVMPQTTPPIKIDAVRTLGAEVVLHGDSYDDAAAHGAALPGQRNLVMVHPFDDEDVIAGQGTIAMELCRQAQLMDAIFVPVGGGGLIAGIAAWIKALRPDVRIIGVEPIDAACLHAALAAGQPVTLAQVGLFVDGVAVKRIGDAPFRVAMRCVDEMVLVSTDQVCAAIRDIFEETRTVVEPAGALALAGIKQWCAAKPREPGLNLVSIVCGANMNFDRLRHVAERAEIGQQSEAVFGVTIPEQPGSFLRFCQALGKRAITEFNYRYVENASAQVFVGIALRKGAPERLSVLADLRAQQYLVSDFSENEAAKLHVRHLVGGRVSSTLNERFFRFEFPERPGALLRFLERLSTRYNITLFHYRNHGAAYGRVLAGFQVSPSDCADFENRLDTLGFARVEETENPALLQFLSLSSPSDAAAVTTMAAEIR